MSDHVIIVGVRRGRELVGTSEIKQMLGRQGRNQNGFSYRSDIILNYDDIEMETALASKDSYEASSTFSDVQTFCFHILPEIVNGAVKTRQDIQTFFDRSLAAYQEKKVNIDKVLNFLEERNGITRNGDSFSAGSNGIIASQLYMHCGDVSKLLGNFMRVKDDLDSDGAIAWALGNLETMKIQGDFGDHGEELYRFKSELPRDYDCEEGFLITSALWWCMMGNGSPGKQMANNVRQLKKRWPRMKAVLMLAGMGGDFLDTLDLRITRNISRELVPFFSDPKMTKGRAMGLKYLGYNSAEGTENIELEDE